ncbi:hypothetical protein NQ176_g3755 [Zarea fungicola]|uniref:Uncharacterized protein n=1 Tax=Zarea fungicola TaxID=93591 RepID=A0ACC1NGU9_9HYPO|nr:hypothetical protein NQ176_g3755 [Lecanicillium fungicola]
MAEWENGLCETDCGSCMGAWCCTCFAFGRASDRLRAFPDTDTDNFSLFNGSCFMFTLASMCSLSCIPVWMQRKDLREKFGIRGGGCGDCMVASCCLPCAVSQINMELKKRAEKQQNVVQTKGYAPPAGMAYGPQP